MSLPGTTGSVKDEYDGKYYDDRDTGYGNRITSLQLRTIVQLLVSGMREIL